MIFHKKDEIVTKKYPNFSFFFTKFDICSHYVTVCTIKILSRLTALVATSVPTSTSGALTLLNRAYLVRLTMSAFNAFGAFENEILKAASLSWKKDFSATKD